jgi:DNA-binding NtrC family response regulator
MSSPFEMPDQVKRVLVVEDDESTREAVTRILQRCEVEVVQAATAGEGKACLEQGPPPDVILIDVRLPDGPVDAVLEAACELAPAPVIVAMSGVATAEESFRLNRFGVREYLQKPFGGEELARTIRAACAEAPRVETFVAAQVGHVGMRDLQKQVRDAMVREALARSAGSRSAAARLLHVTRQAVQQIVRSQGKRGRRGNPDNHDNCIH